jgi:hypothetical protein
MKTEAIIMVKKKTISINIGPVWEGSGSNQNGFGSGYSGGAALLVE